MRFIVSCLATLLCLGATTAFAAAQEPTTDEQKTLYALGLAVNQSLSNFNLSETVLNSSNPASLTGSLNGLPRWTFKRLA